MSHETRLSMSHDEARVQRALDALGQAERDAAPGHLEQRIADATAPLIAGATPPSPGPVLHAPTPGRDTLELSRRLVSHTHASRRASHVRLRWAIAAGLGATVCVTAWLALRGSGGPPQPSAPIAHDLGATGSHTAPAIASTPEAEAEALFLASSMFDDNFDATLGEIATTAATLGLTLTDPLSGTADTWNTAEGESL